MSKMNSKQVTPTEFYQWLLKILKQAETIDLPTEVNGHELTQEKKDAIKTIVSACYNYLDLDSDIVEGIKKVLIYKLAAP